MSIQFPDSTAAQNENANQKLPFSRQTNKFNQNNDRHYDKLWQSFDKSTAGDNRNIPIDLSRNSKDMMKQLKDGHEFHQMRGWNEMKSGDNEKLKQNGK